MIDRETVQKIKDAANIVDVVGDYVHLVRRGANYMGLCPFHNERTPSFSVSPKRNFCHCFSCHKGGSPVNFLMEKEGISYHEALLRLAKKYNIHVEEKELTDEERARITERESMIVASEWAMNFFHESLLNSDEGRNIGLSYLYGRGITDEAIKKYKIGYSFEKGNQLLSKARNEGFDIEVFKKIGLVGTSADGRDYDKFRGRVMFPIRNSSGKPVAFGGRALRGEPAKYINSPETLIYKKSNELYGIFEAKNDIVKAGKVFLMEGYLDVIGSSQSGIQNAVASSGTALTDGQIALLHRFTDNVTLVYDGDSAGIKASLRGIDMLLAHKLHVSMLLLPEGEDPDSFARKITPEEFRKYIEENETDFIEFKSSVLLKSAGKNPQEKAAAVKSVVDSIACIPNEIERSIYIQKCSRLMDMDENVITLEVNRAIYHNAAKETGGKPKPIKIDSSVTQHQSEHSKKDTFSLHEKEIIKYCIRYGYLPFSDSDKTEEENHVIHQVPTVVEFISDEMQADGISFSVPEYNRIFQLLLSKLPEFRNKVVSMLESLENETKNNREKFYEELRKKGGSIAALKKAESEFEANQNKDRTEKIKRFCMKETVDFLINHEEDGVRTVATPLVEDRHVLSSIFTKEGNYVAKEEDKLADLIPRALTELRSEILNNRVKELNEKISKAIEENKPEEQKRLMNELTKLFYLRSRLAENLGERIISPR